MKRRMSKESVGKDMKNSSQEDRTFRSNKNPNEVLLK